MTTHKIKLLSEIIVDKSVYHQLGVEKHPILYLLTGVLWQKIAVGTVICSVPFPMTMTMKNIYLIINQQIAKYSKLQCMCSVKLIYHSHIFGLIIVYWASVWGYCGYKNVRKYMKVVIKVLNLPCCKNAISFTNFKIQWVPCIIWTLPRTTAVIISPWLIDIACLFLIQGIS